MPPALDPRVSRRATNRSMTSPLPRAQRPPSPPAFSNLDCAFPPFPTSASRSASRSGTPVSDDRGLMAVFDGKLDSRKSGSPSRANTSSRTKGQSITKDRIDPIERPSTAGSNRRPSLASSINRPSINEDPAPPLPIIPGRPMEQSQPGRIQDDGYSDADGGRPTRVGGYGGLDKEMPPPSPGNPYAPAPLPASSLEQRDQIVPFQGDRGSQSIRSSARRPPPPLTKRESSRQSQGSDRPLPSPTRSQTFPLPQEPKNISGGPNRRPSEPAQSERMRRPTISSRNGPPPPQQNQKQGYQAYKSGTNPDISSGKFPPRKDSRPGLRPSAFDSRKPEPPPVPTNMFADDLDIGNPYHTPSDSGSSNGSDVSLTPTGSSQSSLSLSPPRQTNDKPLNPRQSTLEVPPVLPLRFELGPDSPTDPLFQKGRLSPIPPSNPPAVLKPRQDSLSSIARPPTRNGTTKGKCRGCSNMILAGEKSVSSADGRLTGRYHKTCFVCHVCRSPFATADFYVLNDAPYCGKHYHEANGSLCHGCGDGIEGQYLEVETDETTKPNLNTRQPSKKDQQPKKYHRTCFTCSTCKIMLNEDYFVWAGKTYCERDAFVAAEVTQTRTLPNGQHLRTNSKTGPNRKGGSVNRGNGFLAPLGGPPGGGGGGGGGGRRFPERRTTKLMMI